MPPPPLPAVPGVDVRHRDVGLPDGTLVCGLADGRLLRSGDRGETWEALATVDGVTAMAVG